MKRKHGPGILIIVLFFGGCTAFQAGPKLMWSSNVLAKADGMNWICVGTMRVGELINPVTWFWTPPARHYFVQQDKAQSVAGSTSDWLVQQNMIDHEEGQITYYLLYDTVSNKTAYIGSDATSDVDIQMNISRPDWKDPETEWSRNTLRWLKDGKPPSSNFCK
jgi:hypothetical protein